MPGSYADVLAQVVTLAEEAGALLRAEFHRPGGPHGERGHAPIDEVVEERLRQRLRAAYPDWGYRGEETRPHEPARDAEQHVWLVDPNDGTVSFIRGQRGSAVSIGLLRAGEPVLGVVYAPCAPDDAGDLFAWAEGCGPLRRNGLPIATPPSPDGLDRYAVVLLSDGSERRPAGNLAALQPARYRGMPSIAYRLALAAAGEGAAAVSLHTPGDWDYGGGHALIRGAGGVAIDEAGRPLRYTLDGESHTGRLFAGPPALAAALVPRPWHLATEGASPAWPDPALPFDFLRLARDEHIADAGLLARAQGCLLGLLAGDSLGASVEGEEVEAIRARFPDGPRELVDGGPYQGIAGQPVLAERALLLARSLVHARGHDAATIDEAEAWYAALPSFSAPGGDGAPALDRVPAAGRPTMVPPGGAAAGRAGRGLATLLLRAAVLGVFGHQLPAASLASLAAAVAARDAADRLTAETFAALAVAVAHSVRSGGPASDARLAALAWAEAADAAPVLREALAALGAPSAPGLGPDTPAPLQVLYNAFTPALAASILEDGVARSCLQGDQPGTSAALTGALLGALQGRDAVPLRWRRLVLSCRPTEQPPTPRPRPRPLWPADLLILAERLLLVGGDRDERGEVN